MSDEPILECSFFVPTRRDANLSDGSEHQAELWDWLDDELFSRFHGGTIAPKLYDGFYRDPDAKERIADKSYKYFVAVRHGEVDQLRGLLSAVCVLFQQKCIYLSVAGHVEFIEAPPP